MKEAFIEGTVYGILSASIGYLLVYYFGFGSYTLPLLLYLNIFSVIVVNMKAEIEAISLSFLKRLVVVAEGEEMKLKRLFTGEEYRVKGDVEKL